MDEIKEEIKEEIKGEIKLESNMNEAISGTKIKTREGSGYLRQLYATARSTAGITHSNLKNRTTFLVNFIPTEQVDASELQVRVHFDDAEIRALSESVKEHGVLQPILVVQDGDRYKVIAGERRLRATRLAGMDRIPARVLTTNDKGKHEIALRENLDRVDLHPLEEGEGYVSLLETKAYSSHEMIAKSFGKPKSRITECIGFTRLPEKTKQDLLRLGVKNRALLRRLLSTAPEAHEGILQEAAGKEEQILISQEFPPGKGAGATPQPERPAREILPFKYRCDKRGVFVPEFRWKSGEGAESLRVYLEALKKFLADAERTYSPTSVD